MVCSWLQRSAHLVALAVGLTFALATPAVSAQATDITITQAQFARSDAPTFPEQAVLHNVALPDLWERSNHEEGPSWYRLQFDIANPQTGPLLGAYLDRACARVELRLNGQLLHADASLRSGGVVRGCHVGVLVPLPAALLQASANHIDIRLEGQPLERVAVRERAALLGPVHIAPMIELAGQAQAQRDVNAGLAIALTTAVGIAGLGALGLAWLSRLPYLGWFAAACLGWAGLSGALLYAAPAMPGTWTDFMLCAAVPPIGLAGMMFLLRYCGLALSWLDSALALQCVVVPLSLVIAVPDRLHGVARPWAYILLAEIAAVLGVFLHRAWRMSRPDFWVVTVALGGFVLSWLAEVALADVPAALPGQAALNVGLLIVFGGLGWRLHQLLQKALATADATRLQLEKRVQEVVSEAERSIDQAAVVRVEEVATKERKRIAADLHDDLGAKLLTIVHTSNDERISTLAREALEEMRLSVRGLSGKPVQLGDSVGDWRSEAMSRLSQGGIELVWNVSDDLLMSERKISARAYVQTTRILREAVSNMIKHSGATQCEIGIRLNDNDFEFNIVDNGKGIPMELDGKLDRGHGMSTMKTRAKQLQGQCLVESGPGFGTAIRLTLPL
jgi:signal transduction histidine kinase